MKMTHSATALRKDPPGNRKRVVILSLCFLPGILYLVVAARRSGIDMFSRLYWEYAGRILNRDFVAGFPEAVQHHLERIGQLPVDQATAAGRSLAPYTDFPCEYPPGSLLIFSLVRLPFDEISSFLSAFQFAMAACCVLATILVLLAVRRFDKSDRAIVACGLGFSVWVLLEGGYTVNVFDSSSALTAALALFFFSRGRPHPAAVALGIGGAIKLWPILILPALALCSHGREPIIRAPHRPSVRASRLPACWRSPFRTWSH